MSAINIKTKDFTALPAGLLTLAKSHMRVDSTFDDALITSMVARAIDWFERVTGVSVFATDYEWTPDADNFCNNVARVPVSPVAGMTAKDGSNADVSSSFTVTTMSTHGVGIYSLNGAFASGLVVTLKSGYADETKLPPGVLDAVLRMAAHLYDNREILVPGAQMATPGWMLDVIATYWFPRA